ncbi:unnamed protein product [Gongylonema pulchrum]|uniref:WYL domain-containing protein n=1 Tax=Gongylonema pulchrum TaxID=637853 RepID=A0A183DI10_9BILA|nr:unnamed protein product [Gongylonema pulchrum]
MEYKEKRIHDDFPCKLALFPESTRKRLLFVHCSDWKTFRRTREMIYADRMTISDMESYETYERQIPFYGEI